MPRRGSMRMGSFVGNGIGIAVGGLSLGEVLGESVIQAFVGHADGGHCARLAHGPAETRGLHEQPIHAPKPQPILSSKDI